MSHPWRALLLCVLVLGGGWRATSVGHLSDDWSIISYVSRTGALESLTSPFLGLGPESVLCHRPGVVGLYRLDFLLFGVSAFPAHVHHLLWHALAVLGLWMLLRLLGAPPGAAALGALCFGWHPYLGATTGWLAARGGTVAGSLTLMALVAHVASVQRANTWFRALALVAAAGAALTQESGYPALVLPLIWDLSARERRPRTGELLRAHLPFALVGGALLGLRSAALGTLGGGYALKAGLTAGGDAAEQALQSLGESMARLLGGVPPEAVGGNLVAPVIFGGTVVIALGWSACLRTRAPQQETTWRFGRAGRFLVIAAALEILLYVAAADPILSLSSGHRWYPSLSFLMGIMALLLTPLWARRSGTILAVLIVCLHLAGFLITQDRLVEADRFAKSTVADLVAKTRWENLRTGPIFVSGIPEAVHNIPTMQWGLPDALRPPFTADYPKRPVYLIHRFMRNERATWPYHPPIEALLYARGIDPTIFGLRPESPAEFVLAEFTHEVRAPDGTQTWPPLPPDVVEAGVRSHFDPIPLEVLEPSSTQEQTRASFLQLTVRCNTEGIATLELFCFLPTMDARVPIPVAAPVTEVELGPKLADYIRFWREPQTVYVVPVGWTDSHRDRPRLGPVLTFEVSWP